MSNVESRDPYWEIVVVVPVMNMTNKHSLLTCMASQIMLFGP
jgi:hypothetical protein